MKSTAGIGAALLLLSSCAAARITPVTIDDAAVDAARREGDPLAVGRLFRKDDYLCTAFHVGNGVVLTAGHCVRGDCHVDGSQPKTPMSIRWSARPGAPAPTSEVTSIHSCVRSYSLDYAVLKVSDPPSARLSLEADGTAPENAGVPLFMLTYIDANTLSRIDGCGSKNFSGSHLVKQYNFVHSCTVSAGASGSPIFLESTRRVVGIHQGGKDDEVGSRVRQAALDGLALP